MNILEAEDLARGLIKKHELKDWSFSFMKSARKFGQCDYKHKLIKVSSQLTQLNKKDKVEDTILHEIAHALTPGSGHGKLWKIKCVQIGCSYKRCYDSGEVVTPKGKYTLKCIKCGKTHSRYKLPRCGIACGACCKKHNNGHYSIEYRYEIKQNY